MSTSRTEPRTLKGFRDFLPAEARKRTYVINTIRGLFEEYGFEPIETPAVEYLETFTGNIGQDEKLFIHFTDHGKREVALRYDQTVPTCRFVAQHESELIFPFKRYQIGKVWRAEKPQQGRYREFLQCDADIFGVDSPQADAEVILLSTRIFETLGFKEYIVKINDRSLYASVPYEIIVAIDKLHKIGKEGVVEEITALGKSKDEARTILKSILNAQPPESVQIITAYLSAAGIRNDHFQFDPSIARSFNYSTGPIWEVEIPGYTAGSVLGGERYDNLVNRFSKRKIPATGFAVGFDRTIEALEQFQLFPELPTAPDVLVTVFSAELLSQSLAVATYLRNNHIPTDIYAYPPYRIDKQLSYANKRGIRIVLIIGPDEASHGAVRVKNLKTGKQSDIPQELLLKAIG